MSRGKQPQFNLLLFTGLNALRLIGLVGLIAAAIFWWPVQNELSTNRTVALAYTIGLVLAPPALWSFLFPWSPGGMLLFRIQQRTIGQVVVALAALYFSYYSYQLQTSWWTAQEVTRDSNMVTQQVIIGLLLYIVIPGLVWTPVDPDEFEKQVKQEQLVKRYDMQTKADIAIMDATFLRAQQRAAIGFANLLPAEREELAAVMKGLVTGMDTTLQRIAGNFNETAEAIYGQHGKDMFSAPPFADTFADMLNFVGDSILTMGEVERPAEAPRVLSSGDQETIDLAPAARAAHVPDSRAMVVAPAAHVDSPSGPVNPRDAQQGRAVQGTAPAHVDSRRAREDEEARQLWERLDRVLPDVVMAKNVQAAMQWQDITPAKRLVARWVDIGILEPTGPNRPGRYSRVEEA